MNVAELFYGAEKSANPKKNNAVVEQFLLTVRTINSSRNIMQGRSRGRGSWEVKGTGFLTHYWEVKGTGFLTHYQFWINVAKRCCLCQDRPGKRAIAEFITFFQEESTGKTSLKTGKIPRSFSMLCSAIKKSVPIVYMHTV